MKPTPLISLALLLGVAAPAVAQPAGGGASSAPAPAPVAAEDFRLVVKDVAIFDAAGQELERWHCEWTEPQDDDRVCISFSGDPQNAYERIKDAGGSSATVDTVVADLEIDTHTTIRERSDGTWLFRTEGKVDGKPWYSGSVCSADGKTCSRYEATSRKRAQRAIRAASARVKKRARG